MDQLIGKLIFVAIVVVVALLLERFLARAVRKALEKTNVPSASIFVNIVRGAVWLTAFLIVLKPVFNVSPNAFVTSLGAASIAISLGLQTTIANLVGGLQVMVSKVVQPGDYVKINNITGCVQDVNWRDTTISDRVGNQVIVPNSQMNSSALTRLTPALACEGSLAITLKADQDLTAVQATIAKTVDEALGDLSSATEPTTVRLTGATSSGVSATIYYYVKPGVTFERACDVVVKAIAGASYLA